MSSMTVSGACVAEANPLGIDGVTYGSKQPFRIAVRYSLPVAITDRPPEKTAAFAWQPQAAFHDCASCG